MPTQLPKDVHTTNQKLYKTLTSTPQVTNTWNNLTPIARRDFLSWINGAKQPATQTSRIERIPSMLASGKRRPCCYAVVPMYLYKALGENPKAKAQWKTLTPNKRRDIIDWVEESKDTNERKIRVEKTCQRLANG